MQLTTASFWSHYSLYKTSFWKQFSLLIRFQNILTLQNRMALQSRFGRFLIMAVVMGLLYFQLGQSRKHDGRRLFYSTLELSIAHIFLV